MLGIQRQEFKVKKKLKIFTPTPEEKLRIVQM